MGTIDSDVLNVESIEWRNMLPFINKQEETKSEQPVKEEADDDEKPFTKKDKKLDLYEPKEIDPLTPEER